MATVTLRFADPKYLLIYEEALVRADELSEEHLEDLAEGIVRVVNLEHYTEILADLTEEEIGG